MKNLIWCFVLLTGCHLGSTTSKQPAQFPTSPQIWYWGWCDDAGNNLQTAIASHYDKQSEQYYFTIFRTLHHEQDSLFLYRVNSVHFHKDSLLLSTIRQLQINTEFDTYRFKSRSKKVLFKSAFLDERVNRTHASYSSDGDVHDIRKADQLLCSIHSTNENADFHIKKHKRPKTKTHVSVCHFPNADLILKDSLHFVFADVFINEQRWIITAFSNEKGELMDTHVYIHLEEGWKEDKTAECDVLEAYTLVSARKKYPLGLKLTVKQGSFVFQKPRTMQEIRAMRFGYWVGSVKVRSAEGNSVLNGTFNASGSANVIIL